MIITKDVPITICSANMEYYTQKGYKIPKSKNKYGRITTPRGTKINVKVEDLPKSCSVKIEVECDNCKKHYLIIYENYSKTNHNGKIYCKKCAKKLFNSGENHPLYKPELTQEYREDVRSYTEYVDFIKKVLARDNYICQCCGCTNKSSLQVHHLDGYNWCEEKRTLVSNGITLCKKCHYNFHSHYGNGDNTKEQFEEWFGKTIYLLENFDCEITSSRKIYCYEEDKIYDGVYDYEKTNRIHNANSIIYNICNHKAKYYTYKGKHFFWYDEYVDMKKNDIDRILNREVIRQGRKKVICIDDGTIYDSINAASKILKVRNQCISNCCNHKQNYVIVNGQKMKMMFYDDYLNN